MLNGIKSLLTELLPEAPVPEDAEALKQLAAAALMIEVATVDEHFDEREMATLQAELRSQFNLDPRALEQLVRSARSESHEATSLFQFTRCINAEFSNPEKLDLVIGMWRVAYADGELDKYEEHIIRRIAELIYLPHSQFIKAKKLAQK